MIIYHVAEVLYLLRTSHSISNKYCIANLRPTTRMYTRQWRGWAGQHMAIVRHTGPGVTLASLHCSSWSHANTKLDIFQV